MPRKAEIKYEESKHYVNDPAGPAIVRFWPGNHTYKVWDPGYINPVTGKPQPLEGQTLGGATSITGAMNKGEGLSYYYMYEMKKFLKQYFGSRTLTELVDEPVTLEGILRMGTEAHNKKSDRGKKVGTDAHWWVEQYLVEMKRIQDAEQITAPFDPRTHEDFKCPEIADVEDIMTMLRKSYVGIINTLKPQSLEDYSKLPKLILEDMAIQEAMWTEASMLRRSTQAAKLWMESHEIFVHGTEGTIYSRIMLTSGKYDADITVKCTAKCNWCYRNGNTQMPEVDQTNRCMTDFKSSNASESFPKGIFPNYLCQTGVYDFGMREELGIEYDAHLILNGSKDAKKDKDGNEYPVFSSHFSFETQRNRDWALACSNLKEYMYEGDKEVRASL